MAPSAAFHKVSQPFCWNSNPVLRPRSGTLLPQIIIPRSSSQDGADGLQGRVAISSSSGPLGTKALAQQQQRGRRGGAATAPRQRQRPRGDSLQGPRGSTAQFAPPPRLQLPASSFANRNPAVAIFNPPATPCMGLPPLPPTPLP